MFSLEQFTIRACLGIRAATESTAASLSIHNLSSRSAIGIWCSARRSNSVFLHFECFLI